MMMFLSIHSYNFYLCVRVHFFLPDYTARKTSYRYLRCVVSIDDDQIPVEKWNALELDQLVIEGVTE